MSDPTPSASAEAPDRYDYCPWKYWTAPPERTRAQQDWHRTLSDRITAEGGTIRLGDPVFVSRWAAVHTDRLELGAKSYIAGFAYLTHDVTIGADCTLNPFSTVRGTIHLGNSVRIGAHTSILGFNHGTAPDREIHRQPTTSEGIRIGDDVWIGSHVVILDGVTIGDHCVIGAGSVVTRDLPDWSIAAGNPARVLRDRRDSPRTDRRSVPATSPGTDAAAATDAAGSTDASVDSRADRRTAPNANQPRTLSARLAAFARAARDQQQAVLERCWDDQAGAYLDRPGVEPTVRAWCDAVEIADLLSGQPPPRASAEEIVHRLRSPQDPDTGLVPQIGEQEATLHRHGPAAYHILCVGYALRLLGSGFDHPIRAVHRMPPDELRSHLDGLDWKERAWSAGSWVDAIGTAGLWNRQDFGLDDTVLDTLFGWLLRTADRWHGMWGSFDERQGRLQVVNGFYRLTRGTFAQYGLPLPYPERAIDTLLAHTTDRTVFGPRRGNACNVLDVIHPLWLCAKQTTYRVDEGRDWARNQLDRALAGWQPGAGFSFALEPAEDSEAGLQGTEMWLAIIWLLADHLGESEALGYRPRGIHRPEPAVGG